MACIGVKMVSSVLILFTLSAKSADRVMINSHSPTHCNFVTEWLDLAHTPMPEFPKDKEISQKRADWINKTVFGARERAANRAFDLYLKRELPPGTFRRCIQNQDDLKNFLKSAQKVFFDRSLEILIKSQIPVVKKFAKKVSELISNHKVISFGFSGYLAQHGSINHDGQDFKTTAAYFRARKAIYADIDSIPPNEWLLTFCHELAHALDGDYIDMANSIFNEEKEEHYFGNLAKTVTHPEQLSNKDQLRFNQWMRAGLDRGLLAEYRAWSITLLLYQAAVAREPEKSGLWWPIDWMDQWISDKKHDESIPQLVLRYLDSHATDPDPNDPESEEFQFDLFQNQLKKTRQEIRNKLPPLNNLADFF